MPFPLSDLLSLPSLPETLREAGLPVYLYGIGDGADKTLSYLDRLGIRPSGVFASDGFVRDGLTFRGFPVGTLADIERREGRVAVLLCFGVEGTEAVSLLRPLAERHLLRAAPFPVYGDGMFDREKLRERSEDAERVYGWLSDDLSRALFLDVLAFQMTGDPTRLLAHTGPSCETPPDGYFAHGKLHVDVGAYDGQTARDYLAVNPRCAGVWAFEPNPEVFRRLRDGTDPSRVRCFPLACGETDGDASLVPHGRGSRLQADGVPVSVCRLDTVCGYPTVNAPDGAPVGSIRVDAEGMDAAVLRGGANLLTACRPAVCVSAYHRAEDLLDLPILLKRFCYRSELYFRKRPCVPAWDTSFVLCPTML